MVVVVVGGGGVVVVMVGTLTSDVISGNGEGILAAKEIFLLW